MTVDTAHPLDEVHWERFAQDVKWGEQNHPNGTGPNQYPLVEIAGTLAVDGLEWERASTLATGARDNCDDVTKQNRLTWADILLEEVFEALAEHSRQGLRTELIQVAAVAVAWVECIDRASGDGS